MPVIEPARDRATEILQLLAYRQVDPLSGAAIARNLGVPDEEREGATDHESTGAALEALVRAGKVVRRDDGRYAAANPTR